MKNKNEPTQNRRAEMRFSPFLLLAIVLILCVGALTILFIWTSLRLLRRSSANFVGYNHPSIVILLPV